MLGKQAVPMAEDPELEKQVNEISHELRCLVCQNQTIADSHADLAVDLKNKVREMLKAGKSKDDISQYMVQRYGDFVLYKPPVKPTTYLLWIGPLLLLVIGLSVLFMTLIRRKAVVADVPLSSEEQDRLQDILENKKQAQAKRAGAGGEEVTS